MSKPLSDESRTMRDRIADLLIVRSGGHFEPIREMTEEKALHDADAILAALGLDDLDAAIERAAWALVDALPGHGTPIHDLYGPAAEKALKAALTATDATGGSDG